MNIQSVDFLPLSAGPAQTSKAAAGGASDFTYWMDHELAQVNDKLLQADELVRKLALGEVDNVHQVMIALDQARLSFQLLTQVRNKLLESYQDVLRMSV
jgi:flagellar hook-basal body complex protein FliE